ncbi:hypothetical protein [Yoonia sp. BS5-3]|uniref:Lipoprotein n=1 Tax=Yoonia phaeophyticola TaxID=3137369 RepID=A0ABZ2V5A7_9RHOB
MTFRNYILILTAATVAGCAPPPGVDGNPFIEELPANVTEIVGPNQNLDQVVLLPEDNCYWYNHAGPVETTLIPLRSQRGRPICVSVPEESADQ